MNQATRRAKSSPNIAPPDLRKRLRLILSQLETIHSVSDIVFDQLKHHEPPLASPLARIVQECIMNALSVQMDELREVTGEYES